jgi:hypothetical protein
VNARATAAPTQLPLRCVAPVTDTRLKSRRKAAFSFPASYPQSSGRVRNPMRRRTPSSPLRCAGFIDSVAPYHPPRATRVSQLVSKNDPNMTKPALCRLYHVWPVRQQPSIKGYKALDARRGLPTSPLRQEIVISHPVVPAGSQNNLICSAGIAPEKLVGLQSNCPSTANMLIANALIRAGMAIHFVFLQTAAMLQKIIIIEKCLSMLFSTRPFRIGVFP